MKILIAMYQIQQLGGIINHTEQLIAGLRELGHSVDMVELHWGAKATGNHPRYPERWTPGVIYPVNQYEGWIFPDGKRIAYRGNDNIQNWKRYASHYDAVIWQTPVPTTNKINKGNLDWLQMYDIDAVNIGVFHDAWFQKRNPHIVYVSKYFDGIVTVHSASYNNALVDIPKVMILNPHEITDGDVPAYPARRKGFLAAHYFKKVKRMDDLVRAIPYMAKDLYKYVAGYGIEYNYMNSITGKCKYWTKTEPKRPIYDVAVEAGMKYLGVLHADQRDRIMRGVRTSIDPSWHLEFAKFGEVWLRSQIEAAIQGTILIATNLGAAGNTSGNGLFWKADKNYIMIPYDSTPELFGEIVDYANNLPNNTAASIQEAAFDILQHWDRRVIAQQYIDFIKGTGTGYFNVDPVVSKVPKEVRTHADEIMKRFFEYKDAVKPMEGRKNEKPKQISRPKPEIIIKQPVPVLPVHNRTPRNLPPAHARG